jgi:L-fuculose-phosphate aldolase
VPGDPVDALLDAARAMISNGLAAGTAGNLSVRVDNQHFVITPGSTPYDELTADDLITLDVDGAVVAGTRTPSSEWALHAACYRRFAEVGSVIHTHPVYATMFACARQPIPPAIDEFALYAGGQVECAAYARSGTRELGDNAVVVLEKVGSALLASHGMVTIGPEPAATLHQAVVVERSAQILWGARVLGGAAAVPPADVEMFAAAYRDHRGLGSRYD